MYVIGITGCAGSGKSFVCDCIRQSLGIPVIDSDSECRKLQEPGGEVFEAIRREFGDGFLDPEGRLDRARLASVVFSDEQALLKLNELSHPATIRRINELLAEYRKAGTEFVFVESALAEKAGYRSFCDELWLVFAMDETRARRLRETRGYSDERIASLFASQVPQSAMFDYCERILDNDAAITQIGILRQVSFYLDDIRKRNHIAGRTS